MSDDNDPVVLQEMHEYADFYLQEKEDRLIRAAIAAIPGCPPRISLPERKSSFTKVESLLLLIRGRQFVEYIFAT